MKIWWIRHGPTRRDDMIGWRDVPAFLDDTDAIKRLDAYLPPDIPIISSDLMRARSTADVIQGKRTRLPDAFNLREFHFGDWEGAHFSTISQAQPALTRAYWETPGDIAPPNGESWNEGAKRVNEAVDQLRKDHSAGVICVSHFGAILTQIQRGAKISAQSSLAFKIAHLSVTCIDYLSDDVASIDTVNHQA